MDEFSLIEKYFKPLTRQCVGALQLSDDAAVLPIVPGQELIVTKDAISAGVHFFGNEDAALIARKLLRMNLSDLAAMGATPTVYFLALMLPPDTPEEWVKRFAEGLAEDQKHFNIHLAGGDTIATHGKLSASITALGIVPTGKALKRSKTLPGDIVYVSGTIGDSALGLAALQSRHASLGISYDSAEIPASPMAREDDENYLSRCYLLPEPRVALGQKLRGIATAAMDISDGLAQDLGHICKASGVGATIRRPQIPLSSEAAALLTTDEAWWDTILSGGDDYELLFTAPPEQMSALSLLSSELGLRLTPIGFIREGSGVDILDATGQPVTLARTGFRHFG